MNLIQTFIIAKVKKPSRKLKVLQSIRTRNNGYLSVLLV